MNPSSMWNVIRNPKAQSVIELTFTLPFLLSLLGGSVDFGLSLFVSHIVQNASREGARLAVTLPQLANNDADVIALVATKIPDINLFTTFKQPGHITVSAGIDCNSTNEADKEVTVEVSGQYNYTLLRMIGFTTSQIRRRTTMRYECG